MARPIARGAFVPCKFTTRPRILRKLIKKDQVLTKKIHLDSVKFGILLLQHKIGKPRKIQKI